MDQNSPVFGNEDSRLFHEKVLRHDIQQAEEELEDIRWKQRDLLTRHKKYIRRLRNICTLQRQYEAELAEKKNDLSGLKKEMWDL